MKNLFKTKLGRLRLLAFLEGSSLVLLVGVAVPVKHLWHDPFLVRVIGPVHGLLFLLFVLNTFSVAVEYNWKFSSVTWKLLLACFIPFGTFYAERKILRKLSAN